MPYSYSTLSDSYHRLLGTNFVRKEWSARIDGAAKRILANRKRYEEVAAQVGNVPWEFIGVIHNLESSLDFSKHLHNGDSLSRRTHTEPKGHPVAEPLDGKTYTWEESAIDALKIKGLDQELDWTLERTCYELERYNGMGYRMALGRPYSPYLWSGTTNYTKGKFTSDHGYDSECVSQQVGAIPVLLRIREIAGTKVTDLKPLSRKLSILARIRAFIGSTVVGWFTFDNLLASKDAYVQVKDFIQGNALYIVGGTLVTAFLVAKYLEWLHLQDYKNGNYTPSKSEDE